MKLHSFRLSAYIVALSAAAFAQEPSQGQPPQTPPPSLPTQPPQPPPPAVQPNASVTTPAMPEKANPTIDRDDMSDHERMVGHLAVGFFGVNQLPLLNSIGGAATTNVVAPTVGVRYWLNSRVGIDAALGLGWSGGSNDTTTNTTTQSQNVASRFAGILHAGVPIALVSAKHYTFEAIPEINFGYATTSITPTVPAGAPAQPTTEISTLRFDIGARAGAELHFGFIGVPQLALQATIGLAFTRTSLSAKRDTSSFTSSTNAFGTTVQASPWAIFTNNISALYYF